MTYKDTFRHIVFGFVLTLSMGASLAAAPVSTPEPAYLPLAARYQEVRSDADGHRHASGWHLTRHGQQVEFARGGYVELWERDERGEISWQRIFHDQRKLISYTPGELRTEHRVQSWDVLNTIIDASALKNLKRVEQARFQNRVATRYRGIIGEEKVEVLWLEAERLPAEITRRGKHGAYRLSLRELRAAPASGWPQADLARAADYEYIDGSDLGDREYEPFVQQVVAMDEAHGGGHAH